MSDPVVIINNHPPAVLQVRHQPVIINQIPGVGPPGTIGGLPPGGDPGDALSKASAADGDVEWADPTVPLVTHINDTRPHISAESGRDFSAWFNAQLT